MNYDQFICAMLECTNKKLPENMWAERQEILKNNGVVAVGLAIRKKGESVAPLIYLDGFYTKYLLGADIEELAETFIEYSENAPSAPEWDYHCILDFQKIKNQVVYKLISAQKNERLLKEVPHLPVLDFAIVFYLMIPTETSECCSVLIRNAHMNLWKLPISILYQYAKENTPRLCPFQFGPLAGFAEEEGLENLQDSLLYILTNEAGINGAAAILYPGMPGIIYERLRQNYYLIPSSIHEFLIVPDLKGIYPQNLIAMLREINETQVQKEEVLFDSIYYFDGNIITKM